MIGFLVLLNLPDKEISYHLKSKPNDYILIIFNQENGQELNSSFTEINFEIPENGILLIKGDAPGSIRMGTCYDKDGQELKILDWGYPGLGGTCPNHKGQYNINAIYFRLETINEKDDDDVTERIRKITCDNTVYSK